MKIKLSFIVETENSYEDTHGGMHSNCISDTFKERVRIGSQEGITDIEFIPFFSEEYTNLAYANIKFKIPTGEYVMCDINISSPRSFKVDFEYSVSGPDEIAETYRLILLFIYKLFVDLVFIFDIDSEQKFGIDFIEQIKASQQMIPSRIFGVAVVSTDKKDVFLIETRGLERWGCEDITAVCSGVEKRVFDSVKIPSMLTAAALLSIYRKNLNEGVPILVGVNTVTNYKIPMVIVPAERAPEWNSLTKFCKALLAKKKMATIALTKKDFIANKFTPFTSIIPEALDPNFELLYTECEITALRHAAQNTLHIMKRVIATDAKIKIFASGKDDSELSQRPLSEFASTPVRYDPIRDYFECQDKQGNALAADPQNVFWWQYTAPSSSRTYNPYNIPQRIVSSSFQG